MKQARRRVVRLLRDLQPHRLLRIALVLALLNPLPISGVGVISARAASVPSMMNFQGRLTDNLNNPLDGSYDFNFKIYDASAAGTKLWEEDQAGVTVTNGVLAVQLGSVTPLTPAVFYNGSAYLEIKVGTDVLSPRERLITSPYAFGAKLLDGRSYDAFVSTDATSQTILGDKSFSGTLSVQEPTANSHAATKFYVDSQVASGGSGWIKDGPVVKLVAPGDSAVVQSTLTVSNKDASGYSLKLSSGIDMPAGTVAADGFVGKGSGLTALNASNISAGSINDARLSANVALLSGAQVFAGAKTFSASPSVTAPGGLSVDYGISAGSATLAAGLNASSGTFTQSGNTAFSLQTSSGINVLAGTLNVADNVKAGKFFGDGSGLTGVQYTGAAGGDLAGSYPNPTLAADRVRKAGDSMTGQLTVGGSSITIVDTNIGGTADSFSLGVTTAADRSVYHLVVSTTGKVGIGTSSPTEHLTVAGNVTSTGSITATGALTLLASPSGTARLNIKGSVNNQLWAQDASGNDLGGVNLNSSGDVGLYSSGASADYYLSAYGRNNALYLGHNTATKIVLKDGGLYGSDGVSGNLTLRTTSDATKGSVIIADDGGSVGVGTSQPSTRLDVNGSAQFGAGAVKSTFSATTGGLTFPAAYAPSADEDAATKGYVDTQVSGAASGWTKTGNIVKLSNTAFNAVVQSTLTVQGEAFSVGVSTLVVKDGNVGIGTTDPGTDMAWHATASRRLTVDGTIFAQAIDVQNNASYLAVCDGGTDLCRLGIGWGGATHHLLHSTGASNDSLTLDLVDPANHYLNITGKFNTVYGATLGYPNSTSGPVNGLAVSGQVGLGTTQPQEKLHVSSGSAVVDFGIRTSTLTFAAGLTAAPAAAAKGMLYYDASTDKLRLYNGAWADVATGASGSFVSKTGDSMTGPLTMWNSTITISGEQGNAFSVGFSTLVVRNGRVGIGTTAPSDWLHVAGPGSSYGILLNNDNGINFMDTLGGQRTALWWDPSNILHIRNNALDIGGIIAIESRANGGESLRVTPGGSVGIGLTNPSERVHVKGNILSDYGVKAGTVTWTPGTEPVTPAEGMVYYNDTDNQLKLRLTSTWVPIATGTIPSGGDFVAKSGDSMTGQLTVGGSSLTVRSNAASSPLLVSTSPTLGVAGLYVDGSNNIGIGTTNPANKLHVLGATPVATVEHAGGAGKYLDLLVGGVGSAIDFDSTAFLGFRAKPYANRGTDVGASFLMYLNNAGQLGIGTQSPSAFDGVTAKLEVEASAGHTGIAIDAPTDSISSLILAENGNSLWHVLSRGDGANRFEIYATDGTSDGAKITALQTGEVGIGTTSPQERLHVSSGSAVVDFGIRTSTLTFAAGLAADPTSAPGMVYYNASTNKLRLFDGGWKDIATGSTGDYVAKAGDAMTGQLTVGGSSLTVRSNAASSPLFVSTSPTLGVAGLYVDGSNRVGIGTTAPTRRTHIIDNTTDEALRVENTVTNGEAIYATAQNDGIATYTTGSGAALRTVANGDGTALIATIGANKNAAGFFLGSAGASASAKHLLEISHDNSNLSGDAIKANMVSAGNGSFTGNYINILKQGVPVLRVNQFGAVGISSGSPTHLLDVNGGTMVRSSSTWAGISSAQNSVAGQGAIYFDTEDAKFKVSENGGGYQDLVPGAGTYVSKAGDTMTGQLTVSGASTDVSSITTLGAVGIGGIGLSNGTLVVKSTSTDAANPVVNVQANNGSELLRVQQDGMTGIGTTSPDDVLDVVGNIDATGRYELDGTAVIYNMGSDVYGNIRVLASNSTNPDGMYIGYNGAGGPLRFFGNTGTTERMRLSEAGGLSLGSGYVATDAGAGNLIMSGLLGIGTTSPAQKVHMSSGTLLIDGDAATAFKVGVSTFIVNSSGNVGIGLSNPTRGLLETSGVAGDTLALFNRPSQGGVSLRGGFYNAIGFNAYDNGSWRSIEPGYTGEIALWGTGDLAFLTGTNAASSNQAITVTERMRISNAGSVGVGTTDPSEKLHVKGNVLSDYGVKAGTVTYNPQASAPATTAEGMVYYNDTDNKLKLYNGSSWQELASSAGGFVAKAGDSMTGQLTLRGASVDVSSITALGAVGIGGIGLSNGTLVVKSTSADATNPVVNIQANNGTELMRVQQDGKAGIGTTQPAAKLQLQADDGSPLLRLAYNDSTWSHFVVNSDGYVGFGSAGVPRLGIGVSPPGYTLDVNGIINSASAVYTPTVASLSSALQLVTNGHAYDIVLGNNWMNLKTGTGNIGMGTSSPAQKVHMSSGTLLIDGDSPTAFKVGVSSFIVNSEGNVGVGTTAPAGRLETVSNQTAGTNQVVARYRLTSGGSAVDIVNNDGSGRTAIISKAVWGSTVNSPDSLVLGGTDNNSASHRIDVNRDYTDIGRNDGATSFARFDNSGRLGVGTTQPQEKLHVSSGSAAVDFGIRTSTLTFAAGLTGDPTSAPGMVYYNASSNKLRLFDGSWKDIATGSTGDYVAKAGDSMTGQLTVRGASVDVSSITALGAVGIGGIGLSAGTLVVRSTSTDATNPVVNIQANNGSELMRVQQDGKAGVGTSAPQEKLDVNGGVQVHGSASQTNGSHGFMDYNVGLGEYRFFSFGLNPTTRGRFVFFQREQDQGNQLTPLDIRQDGNVLVAQGAGNVGIGTTGPVAKIHMSSGTVLIDGDAATAFKVGVSTFIVNSEGEVGIGTTDPAQKLTVIGGRVKVDAQADGQGIDIFGDFNTRGGALTFRNQTDGITSKIFTDSNNTDLHLQAENNQGIMLHTGGSTERMRISDVGNVGVATNNPSERLHVKGNVLSDYGVKAGTVTHTPQASAPATGAEGMVYYNDTDNKLKVYNGSSWEELASSAGGFVSRAGDSMTGQLTVNGASADVSSITTLGAVGIGGIGLSNGTLVVKSTSTDATNPVVNIQANNDAELMRVQQNGRVGIGTTSPGYKLEVNTDAMVGLKVNINNPYNYFEQGRIQMSNSAVLHGYDTAHVIALANANGFLTLTPNAEAGGIRKGVGIMTTPQATANYGLLAVGPAPWDGSTAGYFAGSANGTALAVNAASGFSGSLADLQTAGVSRFRVQGDGLVGIGTSSPQTELQVNGMIRAPSVTSWTNPTSGKGVEIYYNGTSDKGAISSIDRGTAGYAPLDIDGKPLNINTGSWEPVTFGNNWMYFKNTGLVAVGHSNPSEKLHVKGNVLSDFGVKAGTVTWAPGSQPATAAEGMVYYNDTDNKLKLYNGSSWEELASSAGGFVSKAGDSMTGQLTVNGASADVSSITALGAVGIGGIGLSNGTLVVKSTSTDATNPVVNVQANNGTERMRVQQDGKVGIGTTDPVSKLDVSDDWALSQNGSKVFTSSGTDTFVGISAGAVNAVGAGSAGKYNTFVGASAGAANTSGNSNTLVGYYAGRRIAGDGNANVCIGSSACDAITTGDNNTCIGENSCATQTTLNGTTAVGYRTGISATGTGNTLMGQYAGYAITSGEYNTLLGSGAGDAIQDGGYNVAVGYLAGPHNNYSAAVGSVYIGANAGQKNYGTDNVMIGRLAGYENLDGTNNTMVGRGSGQNNLGAGNVFLGFGAGANESGSNKLYIENSNSLTPLIWGNFSDDYVNINGSLGISTGVPQEKLHVSSGNAVVDFGIRTSTLTFAAGLTGDPTGTNGMVYYNESSGKLRLYHGSWGDVAGGASSISAGDSNVTVTDAGDGYIAFTEDNSEHMRLSGGMVGVGTTAPAQKVHMSSGTLLIDGNATTAFKVGVSSFIVNSEGNVGVGTSAPSAGYRIDLSSPGASGLRISDSAAVSSLRLQWEDAVSTFTAAKNGAYATGINFRTQLTNGSLKDNLALAAGSVGIGTAAPAGLLSIMGDNALGHLFIVDADGNQLLRLQDLGAYGRMKGSAGAFLDLADIVYVNGLWSYGNATLESNVNLASYDSSMKVGIGTTSPAQKVHMSSGTMLIDGDAATAFKVGISSFIISSESRVGIGTTTPQERLHVSSGSAVVDFGIRTSTLTFAAGLTGNPATAAKGMLYYNASTDKLMLYNGAWTDITAGTSKWTAGAGNDIYRGVGSVGVGVTTLEGLLHTGKSNDYNYTYLDTYDDGSSYSMLELRKSDTDTVGTKAETDDGDRLGTISWRGVNASGAFAGGAAIVVDQNGAANASFVPADIKLAAYGTGGGIANQLVVHNSGNIGIGTSDPGKKLDIYQTGDASYIRVFGTGDTENFAGIDLRSDEATDKTWQFAHKQAAANLNSLITYYHNGTSWLPRMTIDSGGKVGIGTTGPGTELDVAGRSRFTATGTDPASGTGVEVLYNTGSDTGHVLAYNRTGSVFKPMWVDGSPLVLNQNSGANVGIGTSSPAQKVHMSSGTMLIDGNASMAFKVGVSSFAVNSSGKVGIGTSAPSDQLEVRSSIAGLAAISGSQAATSGTNYGIYGQATGAGATNNIGGYFTASGATNNYGLVVAAGNVGIGTTQPGFPLAISGQNVVVGSYASLGRMYSGADTVLGHNVYTDTSSRVLKQLNTGYYGAWIRMYYNQGISFGTAQAAGTAGDTVSDPTGTSNDRMVITNAGDVGIGTTSPLDRLTVSGDHANNGSDSLAQLMVIGGASGGSNERLLLGYNTTNDNGYIQSVHNASGYTKLLLNPNGGNVRIGNHANDTYLLTVDGDVAIGQGTVGCVVDRDGTIIAGTCISDERLKMNIRPLEPLLDKLTALRPVTYNWRSEEFPEFHFTDAPQTGLVAQEVEKAFPELVETDPKGFRRVNYSQLPLYLLQAIKDQQAEIADIKARLASLEAAPK